MQEQTVKVSTHACEIPLTRGVVTLVDAGDFDWLSQWKWCALKGKYAVRRARVSEQADGQFVHMHRAIMSAPRGLFVDHIDGNPLNNRRANLRLCTNAENLRNRRVRRNSESGIKGVRLQPGGRWQATIKVDGSAHYLGLFDTAEEAARVYDAAATRLHGEFARLNLPDLEPIASSYISDRDYDWQQHTLDRLRWAHGEARANLIALGQDPATNADLKAWRELGR